MSEDYYEKGNESEQEDLSILYKHKLPFTPKFILKDIEISKKDFFLLFLLFNSLVFLFIGQIGIDIYLIASSKNHSDYYAWAAIFNGALFGIAFSIYNVDEVKNPLKTMKYILIFSLLITVVQIFLIFSFLNLILNFLFFVNVFILVYAIMITFKIYLVKTTILERGRVLAFLFTCLFLVIGFVFGSIVVNLFIFIPVSFVVMTIIFLQHYSNRFEVVFKGPKVESKSMESKNSKKEKINYDIIKYYLFFFCFSLTAGLATPFEGSLEFINNLFGASTAILFVVVIFFAILVSLLIGTIFDYFGRMPPLIYVILAVSIATYISSFRLTTDEIPFAVVMSAYIAVFMCVPLLIGDTTSRPNYGKSVSFSYSIIGIGIVIGAFLRITIPDLLVEEAHSVQVVLGTIFMACIACFILLLNIRETLPSKEQNWKRSLIHMYIIHDSGILLYDHAYVKEKQEKKSVSADLKAGGIIGIKKILKEILRGQKEVSTIDHGDRILILKMNKSNRVVFALVAKEELIILRKKLNSLIKDFDKSYSGFLKDVTISGIDMRIFRPIKQLAEKYFGK
ncbi:MAG: hypothetical protein GF383_03935 [Candidatus Lokiarchaeota archaeon]|nr:hypothetical protein [Candidatus Lokiarchaeota archaeon]MBD3338875.1 hypothetical protein [Candidatus Lokiarchaeota archaeon]